MMVHVSSTQYMYSIQLERTIVMFYKNHMQIPEDYLLRTGT